MKYNQQLINQLKRKVKAHQCFICGTKFNGRKVKVAKGEFNCTSCQLVMFNGKGKGVYA